MAIISQSAGVSQSVQHFCMLVALRTDMRLYPLVAALMCHLTVGG